MWDPRTHNLHYQTDGHGSLASNGNGELELELSSISNVVMYCCSKILSTPLEDLRSEFVGRAQLFSKAPQNSELTFLEYCCFKALITLTKNPNFLRDKQFRYLSFEMMIAWEAPDSVAMCFKKLQTWQNNSQKTEDMQNPQNFLHSSLIPLLIHQKSTVGMEAFMHIALAIPGVADVLSAKFLFNALASPNGGRLSFRVYDRYLKELDKTLNKSREWSKFLNLNQSEVVVEVGGIVRGNFFLQDFGPSSWPGRLILTSRSLCFEPIGMPEVRRRWDLAGDLQQVVEPCYIGSRKIFFLDKALSFKSSDDRAIFEFRGVFGRAQRNHWLMVIQEILYAQDFIRKSSVTGDGLMRAFFRSIMGILRFRAVRKTLRANPAQPTLLLLFSMVHGLPQGDIYLRLLQDLSARKALENGPSIGYSPKSKSKADSVSLRIQELFLEEIPCLKEIIKISCPSSKELDGQGVLLSEGRTDSLSVNVATIKVVLSSMRSVILRINSLLAWDEPYKTIAVILIGSGFIMRDLLQYFACFTLLAIALYILFFKNAGDGPVCALVNVPLPSQNDAGELAELQQALNKLDEMLRTCNIFLLKMRSLIFSACPKATDQAILFLMFMAVFLTVFPAKILMLFLYLEFFTRRLPLRQENFECYMGIVRHWWDHIPMPPVRFKE